MESDIKRPLGPEGHMNWAMNSVCSMNFALYAVIEGSISEDNLRKALALLQARHPMLRSRFENSGFREIYICFDAERPLGLEIKSLMGIHG
jgi:hypothetical protein